MSRNGICNTGNQCFINAILQCLASSPFILEFISKYKIRDDNLIKTITKFNLGKFKAQDIKTECKKILLEQLETLNKEEFTILNQLVKHSYDIFIYISFKEIMKKIIRNDSNIISNRTFLSIVEELSADSGFEHLFNGEQNDPHEFLAYLLDKIHNAKSSIVSIEQPENFNELDIYSQLRFKDFKIRYEKDYSYFVKNLYYYTLNCIQCSKCTNKSHNVYPNNIICLSLPDLPTITLYDCLNDMFKIDYIDYKCEKCNNTEQNVKEQKLLTEPKTLIFKLIRYANIPNTDRAVKITKKVQYPKVIDMQKYFCGNNALKTYKLYAVINHSGSMNRGHYYSYVKTLQDDNTTFNDQWVCCNDENVNNISEDEALNSENAYMLFYTL